MIGFQAERGRHWAPSLSGPAIILDDGTELAAGWRDQILPRYRPQPDMIGMLRRWQDRKRSMIARLDAWQAEAETRRALDLAVGLAREVGERYMLSRVKLGWRE